MNRRKIENELTKLGVYIRDRVHYLSVYDAVKKLDITPQEWIDACFEWFRAEDSNYVRHQLASYSLMSLVEHGRMSLEQIRIFTFRLQATLPSEMSGSEYDRHVEYYRSIYNEIANRH